MPLGTPHLRVALCPVTTGPRSRDCATGPAWEPCGPALLLTKLFPECDQHSQGQARKGEQVSLSCRESETWHFSFPTRQTSRRASTSPHPAPLPPCSRGRASSKQSCCSNWSVFSPSKEVSHPEQLGTHATSATALQSLLPVPLLSSIPPSTGV